MGGRGGSSGKGSSGGSEKSLYDSLPTKTVRLRDRYGDYTGEEHTGRVGKGGSLVNVQKSGGKWTIEMGDVDRGFVAEMVRDNASEAYKAAKKALGYK